MGPSVAQDIVETFLPYKTSEESYVTEDIHFIESRLEDYHSRLTGLAAELDTLRRYHRQTLQDLPMGVCSLAKDQEVLMWNRAIEELTGVGAQKVVGSRLSALPEPWKGLLERFIDAPDEHLHKQRLVYDGHTRWLNLHKAAIEEPWRRVTAAWCYWWKTSPKPNCWKTSWSTPNAWLPSAALPPG